MMDIDLPSELTDDPWFKVVDMLQQNWAVLIPEEGELRAVFYGDTCGVFDELAFASVGDAESALRRNGFAKFSNDPKGVKFISIPKGTFHRAEHPNGPIYSSGRFWQ